jgi:hypothetical protein
VLRQWRRSLTKLGQHRVLANAVAVDVVDDLVGEVDGSA